MFAAVRQFHRALRDTCTVDANLSSRALSLAGSTVRVVGRQVHALSDAVVQTSRAVSVTDPA